MDRIAHLENEIAELRKTLYAKENELYDYKKKWIPQIQDQVQVNPVTCSVDQFLTCQTDQQYQLSYSTEPQYQYAVNSSCKTQIGDKLPKWAIERYSRQILLPEIAVDGQVKLSNARVLVVGAGGLGCPAASYLAGAGVGEIGIVDYDTVDLTNIHRQLLHGESDRFMSKVESAASALRRLNSNILITPYNTQLDSINALQVISGYDIVLDCTDNVPTRYLLNDACVLMKVPLISGSALKMEGQLTIYNYKADKNSNEKDSSYSGPCYRCLFPAPPPPETVGSCSANGVCGPVPGTIGSLQALEAIKLIVGFTHQKLLVGRLLVFDGEDLTFRTVRLRQKSTNCAACSESPTITQLLDYETFCRSKAKEKDHDLNILPPAHRISANDLAEMMNSVKLGEESTNHQRHLVVDVRTEPEFNMCQIEGAVNWPIDSLDKAERFEKLLGEINKSRGQVTFLCRRGNDSQVVAQRVIDALGAEHCTRIKDLTGGLHAWAKLVDEDFPIY